MGLYEAVRQTRQDPNVNVTFNIRMGMKLKESSRCFHYYSSLDWLFLHSKIQSPEDQRPGPRALGRPPLYPFVPMPVFNSEPPIAGTN
jgi:hypothetical protein